MSDWDLIVVGSGPAGSSAARVAAEGGLRTLLLEKSRHPRQKPCGGGLSMAAVGEMGIPLPERLIERRCSGVCIAQGRHRGSVEAGSPMAAMVDRAKFDHYLAQAASGAGAVLREEEACVKAERVGGGILVTTDKGSYAAPLAIGADGFFSKVAPLVRGPWRSGEKRFCVIAEISLPEKEIKDRFANFVQLNYGWVRLGYAWVFPKRDSLSLGIGGSLSDGSGTVARFRDFISSFGLDTAVRLEGCWIPVSSFRHPCHAASVMLAGDAAGFVDCFSGEGIRYAMASGTMAAQTALAASRENDFSAEFLAHYDEAFCERHKADLLSSLRLSRFIFRFPDLVLGTMIRSEKILLRYCDVLRGEISFADFARWSIGKIPALLAKRLAGGWK